jgi:phage-related minor tail protein
VTDGGEELGKAQIPIRATLDKLDGDLEQARKKVESSLGGTLKSIGDKVGQIGSAVVLGAVAAVTGALVGIGTAAFSSAMQLDDAYDGIITKTGATGEVLDGLKEDFKGVFVGVSADAETVSGAIAELNSRLGATGQPLRDMTSGLVDSARMMGGDATANAASLAKMMASWGLSNEEGAATLDKLFVATQKSGIGMDQLMSSVQQNGAVLRTMGFSLNDSVAMMATFEKAGLESGQVMAAMKIAAGKFTKAQQDSTETIKGGVPSLAKAGDQLANLRQQLSLASLKQSEFTAKTKASTRAASEAKIHKLTKQITDLEAAMAKGESRTITVAGSNKTLHESLMGTFDAIKNDTDATHALSVGMEVFGARSAPAMVDAIRSGKLELGTMIAALEDSKDAIYKTSVATEDWPERWQKIKNIATVALAPIGEKMMGIAGSILESALPALDKFVEILENNVTPWVEKAAEVIQGLLAGDWSVPWQDLFPPVVVDTIETIISGVQTLVAFVSDNLPAVAAVIGTLLVGAFTAWAYSAGVAAIATIAAMGPVIPIIIALEAVIGLLAVAWTQDWGGMRTTLTDFWTNTGQPIFDQVKTWLEVNIPKAIQAVSEFWTGTLVPAMQAVWAFIQGTVIPIFQKVVGWLEVNIPKGITTVSSFWTGTLLPALRSVWDFLSTNVVSIFTTVRDWLQTTIPAATKALSGVWENTLLPAITAVWDFLDQYIIPIFTTLVDIDIALLNLALQALAGFWENTLKPALETVWQFIQDNVIPIFEALTTDGIEATKTASSALSDFWKNTLQPAMKVVSDFITDKVLPIFKDVKDFIVDFLGPKIQWLADTVFLGLKTAIDGIKGTLEWFLDKLQKLKDLIGSITLPSWMDPGSPTPLELGIIGINAALREMNGLWGDMASQPIMRMGAMMPTMPGQPTLAGLSLGERVTVEVNGNGGQAGGPVTNYFLTAQYAEKESESDLYHTVRMLQILEV